VIGGKSPKAGWQRQRGFSIPIAIFVLVVFVLIGTALNSILSRSQLTIATEVMSIRALMAAESGAERALEEILESNVAVGNDCADGSLDTVSGFSQLGSVTNWSIPAAGSSGCTANVTCARADIDTDNNAATANDRFYTIRSEGRCTAGSNTALRIVQVQVRR
jgi:MSHA biogenesis protein MshP